jgi:hypothetical protein
LDTSSQEGSAESSDSVASNVSGAFALDLSSINLELTNLVTPNARYEVTFSSAGKATDRRTFPFPSDKITLQGIRPGKVFVKVSLLVDERVVKQGETAAEIEPGRTSVAAISLSSSSNESTGSLVILVRDDAGPLPPYVGPVSTTTPNGPAPSVPIDRTNPVTMHGRTTTPNGPAPSVPVDRTNPVTMHGRTTTPNGPAPSVPIDRTNPVTMHGRTTTPKGPAPSVPIPRSSSAAVPDPVSSAPAVSVPTNPVTSVVVTPSPR